MVIFIKSMYFTPTRLYNKLTYSNLSPHNLKIQYRRRQLRKYNLYIFFWDFDRCFCFGYLFYKFRKVKADSKRNFGPCCPDCFFSYWLIRHFHHFQTFSRNSLRLYLPSCTVLLDRNSPFTFSRPHFLLGYFTNLYRLISHCPFLLIFP